MFTLPGSSWWMEFGLAQAMIVCKFAACSNALSSASSPGKHSTHRCTQVAGRLFGKKPSPFLQSTHTILSNVFLLCSFLIGYNASSSWFSSSLLLFEAQRQICDKFRRKNFRRKKFQRKKFRAYIFRTLFHIKAFLRNLHNIVPASNM